MTMNHTVWFQKISIPPPQSVIGNSEAGRGVLKAKIFKEKYDPKLEFLVGWEVQTKKPSVGGSMDIFWNNTLLSLLVSANLMPSPNNSSFHSLKPVFELSRVDYNCRITNN